MPIYVGLGGDAYHEVSDGEHIHIGAVTAQRVFVGLEGDAYHQVYEYDVTAPTVRAFTVTGQANAAMRVAWSGGALVTDDASGVASVKIQRQYTPVGGSGEGWTDVRTLTQEEWEATSGSFDFTPSTSKRHQMNTTTWPYTSDTVPRYEMGFRIVAVDDVGNTTTTSEVKAVTKPYGTFKVTPADQDSYRAGWLGYTEHSVRSGDAGGGDVDEYGCYFYGSLLADRCDGYEPASGRFFIQRYSTWGSSGTWNFQYHNLASASGAATLGGTVAGVSVSGADYSTWYAMPADWLAPIAAGTAKGLALDSETAWRVLYDHFESFSLSGTLELTFT